MVDVKAGRENMKVEIKTSHGEVVGIELHPENAIDCAITKKFWKDAIDQREIVVRGQTVRIDAVTGRDMDGSLLLLFVNQSNKEEALILNEKVGDIKTHKASGDENVIDTLYNDEMR